MSFPIQDDVVNDIQTSFNGDYVVLLSETRSMSKQTGIINIYHVNSRKQVYRLEVLKSESQRQAMKIAISLNGKYVTAFIGEHIILIDAHSGVQSFSTTYPKADSPTSLLVTNAGRIIIGFPDRVVTLYPFAEDKKRYCLYKSQMEINELVQCPDDARFAIVEREASGTLYSKKEKGLICIYNPKDRHQLIQPYEEQLYKKYTRKDWFGEEQEELIYLEDFFYHSFVFAPGEKYGLAWLTRNNGESILVHFSTIMNITNAITPLSSEPIPYRDFKFERLIAVDPHIRCAYFYAKSMTSDKNSYNSHEENDYESHLVAVDTDTGKEIDRFTLKGLSKITVSPNGKHIIYIANNSMYISI